MAGAANFSSILSTHYQPPIESPLLITSRSPLTDEGASEMFFFLKNDHNFYALVASMGLQL